MFDSERNKQHQRVLCNEIRRLPNETIKQLAVRIEKLVRKAYSLNTHGYKNTKMTEILMMTHTSQLRKKAIKKIASHPSSIREPDLDFRNLVDKLEQVEITMKLQEKENLKPQYVNIIETNTTHINNIQDSDVDLTEKITEVLKIYEKNPNFKGKPSFKKWCNYCRRYGHNIAECRQKQQDNQIKPQKYKDPNKSFYHFMKKDQNLPNKIYIVIIAPVNHFKIIQIIQETYHLITLVIEVGHQNKEIHEISYKIDIVVQRIKIISIETTIHDQIQTEEVIHLILVPIKILGIGTYQRIDHEIHHTIETETIQTIGIEVIQIIEIDVTKTIDQETIHTTDLIINEPITTTIIDHEIIHKIGIQVITTNKEIILNLLIEIIIATPIPNTYIEATHRNINDKLIRYKQLKKQLQTPLVSMIQKVLNYN